MIFPFLHVRRVRIASASSNNPNQPSSVHAYYMFMDIWIPSYLFVNDVDLVYQTAIDFGAESIYPPDDMDYGDRQAGIKDPEGNYWWISMRLDETPYQD